MTNGIGYYIHSESKIKLRLFNKIIDNTISEVLVDQIDMYYSPYSVVSLLTGRLLVLCPLPTSKLVIHRNTTSNKGIKSCGKPSLRLSLISNNNSDIASTCFGLCHTSFPSHIGEGSPAARSKVVFLLNQHY